MKYCEIEDCKDKFYSANYCRVHYWRLTNQTSATPEYRAWVGMKYRCLNPNSRLFKNYGGRGITICDEWRNDFTTFLNYVGDRPSINHSLDRIDNDGNYEPGNIRWATKRQQVLNRRTKNKFGHPGIYQRIRKNGRKVWISTIFSKYLGSFSTKEQAINAIKQAERAIL